MRLKSNVHSKRMDPNIENTCKITMRTKNRRYQAMQELIAQNAYFKECEMMKRAPLLYNELIGQYLTDEERRWRDKVNANETLVEILMEGIERDDARQLEKRQEEMEDNAMEEEDTSDEDDCGSPRASRIQCNKTTTPCQSASPEAPASHSQWGECKEMIDTRISRDEFHSRAHERAHVEISEKQKALLRNEFFSLMYQSFLDGRDDYDYATIDCDERFDDLEQLTRDEEDKYFDSEEANDDDDEQCAENDISKERTSGVSSEDELEMFMNSLQQSHPAVVQLSDDFKKKM